jgi:hydroxymethylpyrimidine/phosphomethylpyrimidine kinase
MARIVLTVMRYNKEYRSAMDIRFSEKLAVLCREAGYELDSFNRAEEPADVKEHEGSSLEWGTDYVLSKRDTIPDMIFDRGDMGKEPVIRVLGKNPAEVAEKILRISGRLKSI